MTFLIQLLIDLAAARTAGSCPSSVERPRGLSLFDLTWR